MFFSLHLQRSVSGPTFVCVCVFFRGDLTGTLPNCTKLPVYVRDSQWIFCLEKEVVWRAMLAHVFCYMAIYIYMYVYVYILLLYIYIYVCVCVIWNFTSNVYGLFNHTRVFHRVVEVFGNQTGVETSPPAIVGNLGSFQGVLRSEPTKCTWRIIPWLGYVVNHHG